MEKKKLSEKEKKEIKSKIKKGLLTALHVISYILSAIFIISLIVGCSNSKKPVGAQAYTDTNVEFTENHITDIYNIPYIDDYLVQSKYDSYYQYRLPTFNDVNNLFSDLAVGGQSESVYFLHNGEQIVGDFLRFTYPYKWTYMVKNSVSKYTLMIRAYNTNGVGSNKALITWDFTNGVNIVSVNDFVKVFQSTNLGITYEKKDIILWNFLVYYFSNVSPTNFNAILNDNFLNTFTAPISNGSMMNGFLLYNENWANYFNNDNYGLIHNFDIFRGGFISNNRAYEGIGVNFRSAYYPNSSSDITYAGIIYTDDRGQKQFINANNTLLRNYILIDSVYYTYTLGNATIKDIVYQASYGPANDNGVIGNVYSADSGYSFTQGLYKYLNVLSISHYQWYFGFFTTSLDSLTNAQLLFSYAQIINYDIPTNDTTTIPNVVVSVFDWITTAFFGITPILSFTLLPGLTLGTILLIPFTITIILIIVRLFKR